MELKIIIEKSKDHYSAFAKDFEGINGGGDSIDEVKESIIEAIDIFKEYNEDYPEELDGKLLFEFDTQSFLEYYSDIISRSALSRLTGINEKQLGHYIQGLHKPRKDKSEKIEKALHKLGEELLSFKLV